MSEAPEGYYSWLCPRRKGDWAEHDGFQLHLLACEMKDSPEKRKARAKRKADTTTMPSDTPISDNSLTMISFATFEN
jgi:hypothetical protein